MLLDFHEGRFPHLIYHSKPEDILHAFDVIDRFFSSYGTNHPDISRAIMPLTLPTPKGGGFLRGTHSRELDSQRVRQKPSSHSLEIESMVTFAQDIRRAVGVGI